LKFLTQGSSARGAQDLRGEPIEKRKIGAEFMPEVEELGPQPDLVWDDQVRGLCVRVFGNGSQSFLFVYHLNDRQHFIRIGKTPTWSIEAARDKAKYFRSIIDQGDDPARYNRERDKVGPVETVIQYIAEHLRK
jgi:hypothetical protein